MTDARRLTILFVTRAVPYPLDQGSRIRNYYLIESIGRKHNIVLVALAHSAEERRGAEQLRQFCQELHVIDAKRNTFEKLFQLGKSFLTGIPYMTIANSKNEARRTVQNCVARLQIDIIQLQELFAAGNIPNDTGNIPIILDAHNVETSVAKRIADGCVNPLFKLFYSHQARLIESFERNVAKRSSAVFAVSTEDRKFFEALGKNTLLVPNGSTPPIHSGSRKRDTILFTGTLEYPPNSHGLLFFLETVLPRIRERKPSVLLRVVARRPSAKHLRYANSGVEFITEAEESAPYFYESSALVAPLFAGGGTRLKILQAFSSYLPVVSTGLGAEGLDVSNRKELLIADDAPAFTDAVIEVLENEVLSKELADNAAALIERKYLWDRIAESPLKFYESLSS